MSLYLACNAVTLGRIFYDYKWKPCFYGQRSGKGNPPYFHPRKPLSFRRDHLGQIICYSIQEFWLCIEGVFIEDVVALFAGTEDEFASFVGNLHYSFT